MADRTGTWWRRRAAVREHVAQVATLEQQVARLERRGQDLERILRGLGEGVLAVDRAGIVVHANRAAIELLGLDAAGGLGSHMFVVVPDSDVCELLEDVMRGEEPVQSKEVVVERPHGEQVLVINIRPLRAAGSEVDAEPEGAIAVVRDVTELRRLERARRDFFGNVSHELKTPIAAIRGAVETILDDPEMAIDVRVRFLDGARRHTRRLEALVSDLLALARYEGSPRELERTSVDLSVLAREVISASDDLAAGGSVRLEVDQPKGIAAVVRGDEEALRQALSNLVSNAIAHSGEGGVVRIVLERGEGALTVSVVDQGEGIPAEAIERIFERFYRVDTARSRGRGSTGIGLSIVKHVMQAHGGRVEVDSELGRGSTFRLVLPV